MAFYKLICTHERPSKLRNSLEAYASSWNAGLIQSPDICVVIDSSQEPDQYLSEYRPLAFLRYIHAPGAVVAVKQQLFINRFNPTRFDFVDFSSDEDLYLREPLISESPFIAQLDNSFSWLYFDCNEQMNKHEYLLLRDIRPIASNFLHPSSALSESDKYLASCKFSYPDFFWSLMSGDLFLMRFNLFNLLRKNLPNSSEKIDEIFMNVFMSFATLLPNSSSIRLRNCDDSQALRFTRESESNFRSSFASIYQTLKGQFSSQLMYCIDYAVSLVNQILEAKKSDIRISSFDFEKLMVISIRSYSEALSYDLSNRMYLFLADTFRYNNNFSSVTSRRFDINSFSTGSFRSSRLTSLYFENGFNSKYFALIDPSSSLSDGKVCKLLNSVPNEYWCGIKSSLRSII